MRTLLPVNLKVWPELLVDAALPWIERLNSTVDLLYVEELEQPRAKVKDPEVQAVIDAHLETARQEIVHALQAQLDRIPEAFRGGMVLDHGNPAAAIVRRSVDYDFVICGNDGRTGVSGLFGSMSESLVRGFRKPVLLLRVRPDR
ncbi:MAG: universal stress protein [Deltaproteobacteria bacterium]|nr:universal stress protein [Deltaproteobacteria bacterium]